MNCRTIKAALVDLSGTLHIGNKVIPEAVEALERLKHSNVKVRFVSNTTKESKRVLLDRLTKLGFSIQENEIFTSLTAARHLIAHRKLRPLLMLEDEAMEDMAGFQTENPNAVVVGLAPSKFNYDDMNKAFRLLLDGAPLLAIHKGRYYKTEKDLSLGPGGFVKALEFSSGTTAEVIGKPESSFFLEAIKSFECLPEETVMIGDDVRDDIAGAQNVKMMGFLVKTGKYIEGDELTITPPPFHVFDNFPAAVGHILKDHL